MLFLFAMMGSGRAVVSTIGTQTGHIARHTEINVYIHTYLHETVRSCGVNKLPTFRSPTDSQYYLR